MKSSKVLDVSSSDVYDQLAYDPHLDSLLISGKSLSMLSPDSHQDFNFLESQSLNSPPSTNQMYLPYLHFGTPSLPSVQVSHSGLTLTCTTTSKKYVVCPFSQSFKCGIHYFEVICPISCIGIAFGVMRLKAKTNPTLKLCTTTPRLVGVLIDLEHYVFRLYTDNQLLSFVKEMPLRPGTWTPFIKIKCKDNTVTLNPFCSRYSDGINSEGYIHHRDHLSYEYSNVIVLTSLPQNELNDDLEFIKGIIGEAFVSMIKYCIVSKNKENKCTGVALIQFNSEENKHNAIQSIEGKEIGKGMLHSQTLYNHIRLIMIKEKLATIEILGAKYKWKKEEKPDIESLLVNLKSCLIKFKEGLINEYKKNTTNALKVSSQSLSIPNIEMSKENISPLYLPNTDNLILTKGNMMKLLCRVNGSFEIPKTVFYNFPISLNSDIGITLYLNEAKFLLENMKWRSLGEYLEGSTLDSAHNFLKSLITAVRQVKTQNVTIFTTYIDAKLTLDAAMEAISFERLYRKLLSQEYKQCTRIFALTTDEDLDYLLSIFCKIEEILWSMGQSEYASKELNELWSQSQCRVQAAYTRLLSFQGNRNCLPSETALADVGLIRKEDGNLVHFEKLSTKIDYGIFELNEKSVDNLWEELSHQFPDSKLLSGRISTNVPLVCTLNNFPPVVFPNRITSIRSIPNNPLIFVNSSNGFIGLYSTKTRLTCLLTVSFKSTCNNTGKLEVCQTDDLVLPDAGTDPELGLLFSTPSSPPEEGTTEAPEQKIIKGIEVADVFNPMIFFNENSINTNCPLTLAAIIKDKTSGKYFLMVRDYGYFTDFLKYALKEDKDQYVNIFDGSKFARKEQERAMSHLWECVVNKAYIMEEKIKKGLFGMISEHNYSLEEIVPLIAYSIIGVNQSYEVKVLYTKDNGELIFNSYKLNIHKNEFKLDNSKSLSIVSKEFRILYNDNYTIVVHNEGVNVFTKDTLESVNSLNLKLENKLNTVHLQGDNVIIQDSNKLTFYPLNKKELEFKESFETINELSNDVKVEDLTLTDILAYANVSKSRGMVLEPKEAQSSVLYCSLPTETGTNTKATWNIVGKDKVDAYSFEFDIEKNKDAEILDLTLEFSKNGLSEDEETKIIRTISAQENSICERQNTDREFHLPLIVAWSKGAMNSFNMSLSNLFVYNGKSFHSNYPQPAFIFAHQHQKKFLIRKCIVKSALEATDKSFPIGSGIIYTGDYIGAFRDTPHDFANRDEYNSWLTKRKQCKIEFQSFEPAGFFQMEDGEELTFSLDIERSCRYIYLKPTSFRSKPTKMGQFSSFPMSIEYFGVTGITFDLSDSSVPAWSDYIEISDAKITTEAICEIEAFSEKDNSWKQLKVIKDIEAQKLYLKNGEVIPLIERETRDNKQQVLWHLKYDGNELYETMAKKFRVRILPGKQWKLSSTSIIVYPTRRIESQSKILKNVAYSYLWKCRNDPLLFNKVNKALCKLICNPGKYYTERIEAIGILKNIIAISPKQIELIVNNINLEDFIKINVYQKQTESFAIGFLKQLQTYIGFTTQITEFAKGELELIHKNLLPSSALSGFNFVLSLALNISSEKLLQQILLKMYEIATKYLGNVLTMEHIFLRTRLGVRSYPLSPIAWTAPNYSSKEDGKKFFSDKRRRPVSKRFGQISTKASTKLVLDCGEICSLTDVVIYFKNSKSITGARLNLSIFGVENSVNDRQILIYEKEYSEHIWERLTSAAYTLNKTEFNEADELESLQIPLGLFTSRYIVIEIILKKTKSNILQHWDISKSCKDSIIAEAYGSPQGKEGILIPGLNDILELGEGKPIDKRVGHSANYELSYRGNVSVYRLKDTKVSEEAKSKENDVDEKLVNLQKQLKNEIIYYREEKISKHELLNLVNQIEALQCIQCSMINEQSIEGTKCPEYLTCICLELANIITNTIEKNKFAQGVFKAQTSCNLIALSKALFRNFVALNAGIPRKNMLKFIQNVLLQDVSESDKVKFIFDIIDEFLSQSQTFYSQKAIVGCLDKFTIPEGEVLSHLFNKLKLSSGIVRKTRSKSDDMLGKDWFPQLATSLSLAIRSLRKLPVVDPELVAHCGVTCNYCKASPILGTRFKCGHCSNVDICSNSNCIKNHEDEFADHILISIPKPLPYGPTKTIVTSYKPLLPSMAIKHGTNIHTGIECDNCGKKNIKGIHYLCANCDCFNLCEDCYIKATYTHYKTHVFLRLPEPFIQSEVSTPKTLISHLDPALYPSQKSLTEEPVIIKRSFSVVSEGDREIEGQLDMGKILQVAYKICTWICNNDTMDRRHKPICLKLCSELLCLLLKLVRVESVDRVLGDYGQLHTVISSYLKVSEDESVMKSLIKLIAGIRDVDVKMRSDEEIKGMSREDRINYLENAGKILNIRINLSSSLYQILKSVIEIVNKSKTSAINNFIVLLNSYVDILNSISQIEETLKHFNVSKDDDEELVLPELSRSLSVPNTIEQKPHRPQYSTPSLQFVSNLILVLESFSKSSEMIYGKMWEIVSRMILRMKTRQVVEAKLFERIMESFFMPSPEIQQTTYRKLLDISGKMVKYSNINSLLINLIRSTLENSVGTSREEMAFYICRGWLNILLTGKPYRPIRKSEADPLKSNLFTEEGKNDVDEKKPAKDDNKTKDEEVFAQIESSDMLDLLYLMSNFLLRHLNYGSYKGCIGGNYNLIYRSILSSKMLKIITKAKVGPNLTFKELLGSCQDKRLFESFSKLLHWIFLNYSERDNSSKLLKLICKISKNIKLLFKCAHVNESLCKHVLNVIQDIVKITDKTIALRLESHELPTCFGLSMNKRLNSLLKKLMRYMLASPALSYCFAFELKGFDFLVRRLGIVDELKEESKTGTTVKSDIAEIIEDIMAPPTEVKEAVTTKAETPSGTKFSSKTMVKDDFGRNMSMIECIGEPNINSQRHVNWCRFKTGQRSKVYTLTFKEGNKDEVIMTFDFSKLIEIKEIQIAFINFWGMDDIEHIDVSSVIVEISSNNMKYEYLCTLSRVVDKSIEVHGTTVFGKNLEVYDEVMGKDNIIEQKLASLKNTSARYIRLIIRTGVKVTFSGTQASKSSRQKAIAVNYMSVIGYDLTEVPQVKEYINSKNQEVAYKVLNMFQLKIFRDYIEEFVNTSAIINQLKSNFRILMSLINSNKQTIEPFLTSLCAHNKEFSKWILQELHELMMNEKNQGFALFMVQVCLSNLDNIEETQRQILSFLLNEIKKLNQVEDNKVKVTKSLTQLIMRYVSLLELASSRLTKSINLNATEEEAKIILDQVILNFDNTEFRNILVKLLMIVLKPPNMIIGNIDLVKFITNHLIKVKTSSSLFLSSLFAQSFNEIAKEVLTTIPEEFSMQDDIIAYKHLRIILNLTQSSELRELLITRKFALNLYAKLRDQKNLQTLVYTLPDELLNLVKELIQKVTLGDSGTENKLAKAMIDDLILLKNIKERNTLSKLILDIMRAELTVPVCLYPFDSETEQCKSLMSNEYLNKEGVDAFFLNTKILHSKHKQVLMTTMKQRIGDESVADQLFEANWRLIFKEQDAPLQNSSAKFKQFFKAIGGKGPFLFILSGESEGKQVVIGGFNNESFPQMPNSFQNGQQLKIKSSPESIYFYYSDHKYNHFELRNKTDNFGNIYIDYSNSGACLLGGYFLTYSYSSSYSNNIGNLSAVKCIDGNVSTLPFSFTVGSIEIWAADREKIPSNYSTDKTIVAPLSKVLPSEHSWYSSRSPHNYLRSNVVFNVPAHITAKEFGECIVGKSGVKLSLRYKKKPIDDNEVIEKLYKENANEEILDVELEVGKDCKKILNGVGYTPQMPILECFEKLGGYTALIEAAKASLSEWKNEKLKQKLQFYLEEIVQFSNLSNFLKAFLSNRKCRNLLFDIMAGTPDKETTGNNDKELEAKERKWDDQYNESVTFCLTTVSQLFTDITNVELRQQAAKSGSIKIILECLNRLSNEKPRKWHDNISQVENVKEITQAPVEQKVDNAKKKPKKGVGYSTQIGEIWDVDKYIKSKDVKNNQISLLVTIISNFISCEKWEPDDEFLKCLCESSLLPSLESSLACSSLLEMAKDFDLVTIHLSLLEKFCSKPRFAPLLLELDPHYLPKQHEPLYKLLKKLDELGTIFLWCMKKEANLKSEDESPRKLADHIQRCYKNVMQLVRDAHKEKQTEEMKNILSLPLPQAYKALLRDMRFGYINMRDDKSKYNHFYHSQALQEKTAAQEKLIRLAQELADLSNSLPEEHTNAIFIRVDDERIDYMKAIIMGSSNTPYAHGAFEYDIYCPRGYPNESPKVNLCTTGSGAIRFNPNLYHDGKVCLSLLGTWRGTATENWDPKFSTILQVLVSIQAIVMSEEVYFNEPGFEGEIGKAEGEKKNEGYSNIVRYGNIKYAMINQIKNPPKGFEEVIRRHFYVKKPEILKEVHKWIEYADTHEALYEGLVRDHNPDMTSKFKNSKEEYKKLLTEAVKELEKALNDLEPPKELAEKEKTGSESKVEVQKSEIITGMIVPLEAVDVSEDTAEEMAKKTAEKISQLNVEDAGVKDRWSRYIGAVGIEAVAKQAKSTILLSGAGGLGIEIAKNLVLSGCKEFVIQDDKLATQMDLSSQFFLTEADIGKNRAEASVNRLQQLNYYVKVTCMKSSLPTTESELDLIGLNKFTVIILTDCNYTIQIAVNEYCRKHKIPLIVVDVKGTLCKLANDFGTNFQVLDPDGEEAKECMIKEITNEENGLVTTITGQRHGFSNDDTIVLQEVEGMKSGESSINGTLHKVKFVDPFKFRIGDTSKYNKYIRNGIARQLKLAKSINFKSLNEAYNSEELPYDTNLLTLDFAKTDNIFLIQTIFHALNNFETSHKRLPTEWNKEDAGAILELVKSSYTNSKKTLNATDTDFVLKASYTAKTTFSPLCAFMGGIAAQEAIKAITGKYTPINQLLYYHVQELLPATEPKAQTLDRYIGVRTLLGDELFNKLANWKLFMVGVGAIGCELLKNYALLGLGSKDGRIVLTDPDVIEVSNLNRQFLFKEKHVRKPKSTTAAAAIVQMNPTLEGKVVARTDKVSEDTCNIYDDKFFGEINVVTNALDNVQARRYIDSRCIINKVPLLESGTLGSKGHVQVIIPYKTESYSSQNDPEEEIDIPVCTLKMFPEEPLHCIEWARDKFEKIFTQKPKNLQKLISDIEIMGNDQQSMKLLDDAMKWIRKMPHNFNECVNYARRKFKKYFENDIKQLLYVYPPDAKGKDGQLFWTLPKRPPHEKEFDCNDPLHVDFIMAVASLFARVWGISVPSDIRKEEAKKIYAVTASKISLPKYVPNEEKAKSITKEVEEDKKDIEISSVTTSQAAKEVPVQLLDELEMKMTDMATNSISITPENFEKDDDTNFHIDFIYAMANCRAACYGIKSISWMDTKMKAGRIVPALATTTSVVAALQTLELVKLIKATDIEIHRNAFVNLALPYINLSQPGPAKVVQLTDKLNVTIWDRWDIKLDKGGETIFGELMNDLKGKYSLEPRDVFRGNKPIYMSVNMSAPTKAGDKAKLMATKLSTILHLSGNESYVDLTVTFTKLGDEKLLNGVPLVRLILK